MKTWIPKFLSTIVTGLLAGAFVYGLFNVVPTFYEVPVDVHLAYRTQLMNHNSTTMQFLMLASIITPSWYAIVYRHRRSVMYFSFLSAILALTSLLVTRFGNVPINQLIRTWPVNHPPASWTVLLHKWDQYNLIRSMAAVGSFISFITAAHWAFLEDIRSIKAIVAQR